MKLPWIVGLAMMGGQAPTAPPLQAIVQSVEVPAGERLVLKAEGRGVQIYRCDGAAWSLAGPEAKLFVGGAEVGTHAAGPMWRYKDGSAVWGEVMAKAASKNADAVPLLLLKSVKNEGSGVLAGVNYIQRLETRGGVTPVEGCDGGRAGVEARVEYSAEYLFYRSE